MHNKYMKSYVIPTYCKSIYPCQTIHTLHTITFSKCENVKHRPNKVFPHIKFQNKISLLEKHLCDIGVHTVHCLLVFTHKQYSIRILLAAISWNREKNDNKKMRKCEKQKIATNYQQNRIENWKKRQKYQL